MKRGSAFLFFVIFLAPALFPFQNETLQSPSGVVFNFTYRALEPGEVIIITLAAQPPVKKAVIRFLEGEYILANRGEEWAQNALVGLDLALKAGLYSMKFSIERTNGEWETLKKDISVSPREFPVRKLWVEEKFVTPPPSAQEKIRMDAELLEMVYSVVTPFWLGSGNFTLPSSGEVVPNFGERRIYNNRPRSSHSGVDVSAPQGEPVVASNSGRVVLASDLYFSGKTVIIDHGLGLFSLYCHFSKILVRRGQLVRKGEVIGEIGATGRVTGPHLHWGFRLMGTRVDPFALLNLPFD